MPLKLDINKKLSARSERVKSVDFHPHEPWVLSAVYSGHLFVWDYQAQVLLRQVEVSNSPVRSAKFVARKQWIVTASDDMIVRVFNYNSMERLHEMEAHADFVRCISVHPSMPYIITASDDMTIKLFDWDKDWASIQVFEGHAHYVMMVCWNPRDDNIFASCSLDRSIKVWGIASGTAAHLTLNGHQHAVNCVDYMRTGDKPYLISGSDDNTVRIWDYQMKACVQTLSGHTSNITTAVFHPSLPIVFSGSEDGTVKLWHASTYRLETTLTYPLERVWSVAVMKGSNAAAIGYDEGTVVIKLGSEEPIVSMHAGKVVWAKGTEIQMTNLKQVDEGHAIAEGDRLALNTKDMGTTEIYPQSIAHHPNGRLFAVCGDGEYIIYTSQALRSKSFGSALEFVWSHSGAYATRDASGKITVFQDFTESFAFSPPFLVDEIFGGHLIGVRSGDFICFYDWNQYRLIRRIDVSPKLVVWSDDGSQVVLACAESFYVLSHDTDVLNTASATDLDDEGIEAAFSLVSEVTEKIDSGAWVGECFVYISSTRRLTYMMAGASETLAHLDSVQYLLGYIPEQSKLYIIDKELNICTYALHQALVQYHSAVMRKDMEAAQTFFLQLPETLHNRVARFLEAQGLQEKALEITKNDEHKFELAMHLGRFHMAADILASITSQPQGMLPRGKWKRLGDVAMEQGDFALAKRCFAEAKDLSASFLIQTACGDAQGLEETASMARDSGCGNISMLCYMLLGQQDKALNVLLEASRLPEAAFFARTYIPSELPNVVTAWKDDMKVVNQAVADALANPMEDPDLFPGYQLSLDAEQLLKLQCKAARPPAHAYMQEKERLNMDIWHVYERLAVDVSAGAPEVPLAKRAESSDEANPKVPFVAAADGLATLELSSEGHAPS
mmetsp:Transcript_28883/g.52596  ORF Transcript_28883/g.52596 Transcript_28883/m.52596 type:complete len:898 (-) Transcript_28883:141-2834(-)